MLNYDDDDSYGGDDDDDNDDKDVDYREIYMRSKYSRPDAYSQLRT